MTSNNSGVAPYSPYGMKSIILDNFLADVSPKAFSIGKVSCNGTEHCLHVKGDKNKYAINSLSWTGAVCTDLSTNDVGVNRFYRDDKVNPHYTGTCKPTPSYANSYLVECFGNIDDFMYVHYDPNSYKVDTYGAAKAAFSKTTIVDASQFKSNVTTTDMNQDVYLYCPGS